MSEGFDSYRALVTSVENTSTQGRVAVVQDQFGNLRTISAQVLTGGGTVPQAGEVWEIERTSGGWVFARLVKPMRPVLTGSVETGSTLLSLVSDLAQVGLIEDQTTQIPAGTSATNYPPGAVDKDYLYWNLDHADWTPGDPHQVYMPTPNDPTTLTLVMSGDSQRLTSRFIGEIIPWPSNTMPDSTWMLINGQAISRTVYSTLYGLIGTTYGAGDGSTTFNLPTLTDRFPLGKGSTYTNLGAQGGEAAHTLTVAELAAHGHTVSDPGHTHAFVRSATNSTLSATQTSAADGTVSNRWHLADGTAGVVNQSATTGITVASTGSGTAHNNMPPYTVLNWIIKVAYSLEESFTPGTQGLVAGSDLNQFQIAGDWSATPSIASGLVHAPYTALAGTLSVRVNADGTMITQQWATSGNFAYHRTLWAASWSTWEGVDNPVGTPIQCLTASPPAGYLLTNGALVSRTTYATLFAKIGTTYGAGDGTTTFALPTISGSAIRF